MCTYLMIPSHRNLLWFAWSWKSAYNKNLTLLYEKSGAFIEKQKHFLIAFNLKEMELISNYKWSDFVNVKSTASTCAKFMKKNRGRTPKVIFIMIMISTK